MIQIKSLKETVEDDKMNALEVRLVRIEEDLEALERVVKVIAGVLARIDSRLTEIEKK